MEEADDFVEGREEDEVKPVEVEAEVAAAGVSDTDVEDTGMRGCFCAPPRSRPSPRCCRPPRPPRADCELEKSDDGGD